MTPLIKLTLTTLMALFILNCSTGTKSRESQNIDLKNVTNSEKVLLTPSQPKPIAAYRFELSNGLKVVIIENHESPTFAYHTWFNVGSRNEVKGYTGLAHLFEHMMFKATKTYKDGQFDHILESAGAEGENAFTNRDYTAYVQELPKEHLELIMKLESDRMVNLIVDENAFNTEREVVQNERRMRTENSPDGTLYQELYDLAFTTHPYHWPVIGYAEDLTRMTAQDARDFYTKFYNPAHAVIVISGDVDTGQTLELIKKYYLALPGKLNPNLDQADLEPEQTSVRRKQVELNIQVEKLLMAYHIPGTTDPDSAVLDIIQTLLGGGKSSRLYRALVNTGVASGVDSFDSDDKHPSLFIIGANLQNKKKAAQAESIILNELERLTKQGPNKKELERAKNKISFSFYQALSNDSSRANWIGQNEILGGNLKFGLDTYKRVSDVSAADVKRVAQKYFSARARTVVSAIPKRSTK